MDEAELDKLGDLSIDDDDEVPAKEEGKEKASTSKGLDAAAVEDNEEVMPCFFRTNYNMTRTMLYFLILTSREECANAKCVGSTHYWSPIVQFVNIWNP